jgi:hypothetical protein
LMQQASPLLIAKKRELLKSPLVWEIITINYLSDQIRSRWHKVRNDIVAIQDVRHNTSLQLTGESIHFAERDAVPWLLKRSEAQNMDTVNKKRSHDLTWGEDRFWRYKASIINLPMRPTQKTQQHGF